MFETLGYFLELSVSVYFFIIFALFVVNVCEFAPIADRTGKGTENLSILANHVKGDTVKSPIKDGLSKSKVAIDDRSKSQVVEAKAPAVVPKSVPSRHSSSVSQSKSTKSNDKSAISQPQPQSSPNSVHEQRVSGVSAKSKSSSAKSNVSKLGQETESKVQANKENDLKAQVAGEIERLDETEQEEGAGKKESSQAEPPAETEAPQPEAPAEAEVTQPEAPTEAEVPQPEPTAEAEVPQPEGPAEAEVPQPEAPAEADVPQPEEGPPESE